MLSEAASKRIPWILLAFVGAALILDFLLWWASLGYALHTTVCDPTRSQDNCPCYNALFAFAMSWAYDLNYWGVLVTAIATAFIAWFTFSLRDATRQQATIAERSREHFRVTERAYMQMSHEG